MMKICTKCGLPLPWSDFYWDRTKKDGLTSSCKLCSYKPTGRRRAEVPWEHRHPDKMASYRRKNKLKFKDKYRIANRDRRRAKRVKDRVAWNAGLVEQKTKRCKRCERYLDLEQFRKTHKALTYAGRGGLGRHGVCKECESRRWDERSLEQKQVCLRRGKRYREENSDKIIAARTVQKLRRRALEHVENFTAEQWADLQASYGFRCLRCGIEASLTANGKLSPDHILPIAKGGSNTIDNIQPLCWPCNQWKKTKFIDYRPALAS